MPVLFGSIDAEFFLLMMNRVNVGSNLQIHLESLQRTNDSQNFLANFQCLHPQPRARWIDSPDFRSLQTCWTLFNRTIHSQTSQIR